MKLLTLQETKDLKNQELARDTIRSKEIREELNKKELQLAKSEADFKQMMATFKQTWADEEENHKKRVQQMISEIENLEKRKQDALIPIDFIKKEAEQQLKEVIELSEKVKKQEQDNFEISELLAEKLDAVSEREQQAKKREIELVFSEQGVQKQKEQIKKHAEDITKFIEKQMNDLALKVSVVAEREKELNLQAVNLDARQDKLTLRDKTLNQYNLRLQSERQALDEAWKQNGKR